jgi:(1->4)-alpha-D-glucan 1-alpha-D-glucosylmutase
MSAPRATMRLQFHRGFGFADAAPLAAYFASLGISHVYASPILTARPGSMHGYDVVDPTRINPELGGEDAFRRFVEALRRHELGLIVDIVPNHMAIGSSNAWWTDVLARGRDSRYAKYFDIDWCPPNADLRNKVLLPILGRPYGEAMQAGEITAVRDQQGSGFVIRYFDHIFPLAKEDNLSDATMATFDTASSAGRQRLHDLLERQHYRLAWWRTANDEINWRRFFDINELAAIRVEDDDVFDAVHATFFRLYGEGLIDGVRVDHIDGLSQPENYCRKLRRRLHELDGERPENRRAGRAYFVVEKILARHERLPASWETDGTTGYDFMGEVSALLHDERGEQPLRALWQRVSGRPGDFDSEEELARRQILQRSFSAQLEAVVEALHAIAQSALATRDYSRAAIRRCLTEILAHFPVYRIYARVAHASQSDDGFLAQAIEHATTTCLPGDAWLLAVLDEWLSGTRLRATVDGLQAVALTRFQQLSAPLCAKAVEDTAFYRYGRLISRNDVGFDARRFASPPAEFHRNMVARANECPDAMLATATHDHKRGEDVRARLAVLSEIPDDWALAVDRWLRLSAPLCAKAEGTAMPSAGDIAILFQTIVGAWPLKLKIADEQGLAAYAKRVAAWQQKALREAKLQSDWSAPNNAYEQAAEDFIAQLFSGPSQVLNEIADFAQRIGPAGAANGLAQVLVKLTTPGVPDIYQGTEYWDLSLVDPDNRSPVDFALRQKSLSASKGATPVDWTDGLIKQFLIARVLAVRKKMHRLFSAGAYVPLEVAGALAAHVVAFARILEDSAAISVICRFNTQLLKSEGTLDIFMLQCKDTRLVLPAELRGSYSSTLLPDQNLTFGHEIDVGEILGHLPIAFLIRHSG